jgi:hypothetical protein
MVACAKSSTYGYQYRVDQQLAGGEDPEPAPVEARRLLAGARTVAFYPPDRCVNTTEKAESEKEFRANCGALLSLLERAAERAGYEVVSWVNLRGSSRPIDYAREAKVDVLFEINEVAADEVKDVDAKRTLTFFDRNEGIDSPLNVSNGVAQRCRDWSRRDPAMSAGYVATIDIKTVSVSDGRARWHYRKTLSQPTGMESPKVRFVGRQKSNKGANTLTGIGFGFAISGLVFLLVDNAQASGTDPITGAPKKKLFGDLPYYMMIPGLALGIGGVAWLVAGGVEKPSPDEVLCNEANIPSNGMYDGAPAPVRAEGPASSQHTFDESRRGSDSGAKQKEKLTAEMISDFVKLLVDVKASAPAAVPAPAPASP